MMKSSKVVSALLLGALLAAACGKQSESRVKEEGIDCSEAAGEAQAAAAIGKMIDYALGLAAMGAPAIGTVTGVMPISTGNFFGSMFGGPGCDTMQSKLGWFIKTTERRMSDIWEKLREVENADISRDVSQEQLGFDQAATAIEQKIAEIKADPLYKDKKTIPNPMLSASKDEYLRLANQFASIERNVSKQTELAYMSKIFTTAVPSAIIAAANSQNLLVLLKDKKIENEETGKQTVENIKAFRQNFGNMLYTMQNKVQNYPGVEFEIMRVPNLANPPKPSLCRVSSKFKLSFVDEKIEFRIRVFGKPFATGLVSTAGKSYDIDLGYPYPSCWAVDDHPAYMQALTKMIKEQDPDAKKMLAEVQGLYNGIQIKNLEGLRKWLGWVAPKSPKITYYDGFLREPAYGSKDRATPFDDQDKLGSGKISISQISFRAGDRIDQICITPRDAERLCHGSTGGEERSLTLESGEYVSQVEVGAKTRQTDGINGYKFATRIHALKILTSKGREISGGDWEGTLQYKYTAPAGRQIVGFHGNSGDELDALGAIYGLK